MDSNDELAELFQCRHQLHPYGCLTSEANTSQALTELVEYIENEAGIPLPQDLPRDELHRRLHYATDGTASNLLELLREASYVAWEQGS